MSFILKASGGADPLIITNGDVGKGMQPAEAPPPSDEEQTGSAAGLLDSADADIVSAGDGDWATGSTWSGGVVPGIGDKVHIRSVDTVTYDQNSTNRLEWVLIDGALNWDTSASVTRKMYVGTLLVSSIGSMTVGTTGTPIPSTSTAEIYIADLGAINIVDDPKLLGRGIISLGSLEMHGATKTPYERLSADVSAGASSITLESTPSNWEVGDKILIAASRHEGWGWNGSGISYRGHEDEVHEISSISTNTVTLVGTVANARTGRTFADNAARMGTTTYRPHVANLSRNVRCLAENVDSTFAISRRGHWMNMGGNASVDTRYVEIYGFGRTDRRATTIDPEVTTVTAADDNVVGRYAWHCHFMGTTKAKQKTPPVAFRMTVWGPEHTVSAGEPSWAGAPGWGLVQHSSGSNWYQNVTYGCLGAHLVSEDGSETGTWNENLMIWGSGQDSSTNPKNDAFDDPTFIGVQGDGMFSVGRMVRAKGNICASMKHGFTLFHRTGISATIEDFQIPEILWNDTRDTTSVGNNVPPINHWDDNEVYASYEGCIVVKSTPRQEHEKWTFFSGNIAWNVINGWHFEYTGKYSLLDFRALAYDNASKPPFSNRDYGIILGPNTLSFAIVDATFEGVEAGVRSTHTFTATDFEHIVVGLDTDSVTTDWEGFDATKGDVEYANQAALPGSAFSPCDLNYTAINSFQAFAVSGTITDQAGTRDVQEWNVIQPANDGALPLALSAFGYWQDGANNVVFYPFWFTDRISGENYLRYFKIDVDAFGLGAYTDNGAWTAGTAPTRADITDTASSGVAKTIDVTTAATDVDGDTVTLAGTNRTANAEVIDNGDGTIEYRSDFGFTGADTFNCWITDGKGNATKVGVTVTVS